MTSHTERPQSIASVRSVLQFRITFKQSFCILIQVFKYVLLKSGFNMEDRLPDEIQKVITRAGGVRAGKGAQIVSIT